MSTLGLVLKTVERCNLNCKYCYFFNGLDNSYKIRPKFISRETIQRLASFLSIGVADNKIDKLIIGLHGGEPLMQAKNDFIYLVNYLQDNIDCEIEFSLQTNATLVNKEWVDLLNKYKIFVGISIDGPAEYHDKYRVDHYFQGSHQAAERGAKLLLEGLDTKPGCLTVINPEFEGKIIYQYLKNLGFAQIDFLFPDCNHDTPPPYPVLSYSKYLKSICDEWAADGENINVRILQSIFNQLLGAKSLIYGFGNNDSKGLPFISIRSDGEVSPTDELMSTNPSSVTNINKTIFTHSLSEVLQDNIFLELQKASFNRPPKCQKCVWYNACGVGNLVSRFSNERRFNNHSIYCEALEEIVIYQMNYLIRSGINTDIIKNNLLG